MQKQKEIEYYLSCVICKFKFNKTNKPLIMFCGHNICEECKLKFRKKIICQTCGKVFSKREIKKFPINYAILENKFITMLEEKKTNDLNQDSKNGKEENVEKINVVEDKNNDENRDILIDININNIDNQNDKEKTNPYDEIIKERELIFKDTFDLIDNLEKNFSNYLNIFFDSITNIIKTNSSFLIDDLNICQLLQESGIINYGDSIKLKQFLDIINDIEQKNVETCKSFNDIYDLIKEKKKDISYDQFISLFFFFNKIFELKIKKIPKILEEQKKLYTNEKENYSNLIHFLNNLSQKYEMKLSDIFYDTTIYRKSHFIYDLNKKENINIKKSLNSFYIKNEKLFEEFSNIILFYEPIEKQLRIQILKIKELKEELIIDSYLILNQLLFILTDKKMYVYETNTNKYSSFDTISNQEIEKNTKIFKYDTFIMKISSNYFENINLRNYMSKNEWRSLSLYENTPGQIKKPYPICHSSDYVYVLDQEEKNINNIYLYNGERDSWEKKEIILAIEKNENEKGKTDKDNNDNKKIKYNKDNNIIDNNKINNDEDINMDNNDVNNHINSSNNKEKEELIIVKKLYLEDYFFFNKCYACIFGGRHPTTKKFNKNIYMIDTIKGIIKSILKFDDFINDDMVIINLNVGILNKYVDFIFLYHFINDENIIKIKIIRKEILENDISIESKLEVITDIDISKILENN